MFRRIALLVCLVVFTITTSAYALETKLLDMRTKFLVLSKSVRAVLLNTKDVIWVNNMWDSCVLTLTQLDAYFSMVGIVNASKTNEMSDQAIKYLSDWLKEIKQTSELNITGLANTGSIIDSVTKSHMEKLKDSYAALSKAVDGEISRLNVMGKGSKGK